MFIGDIEALLLGSRCVRLLETHALLRGTYPIITSPWPGLAGSHTLWHSTYKCLSTTYLQVGVWRVCWGVHEHRHGFDRSISGCVGPCVTTMPYSPVYTQQIYLVNIKSFTLKNKNFFCLYFPNKVPPIFKHTHPKIIKGGVWHSGNARAYTSRDRAVKTAPMLMDPPAHSPYAYLQIGREFITGSDIQIFVSRSSYFLKNVYAKSSYN